MKDFIVKSLSIIALLVTLIVSITFSNQFNGGLIFNLAGSIFVVVGSVLWGTSLLTLGKNFTPSLSPKGFVTRGIYSKIRHPMYCGGFLIYLGIGFITKSVFGLLLTFLLLLPLLIYSAIEEERQMTTKYGNKYLGYKKNVLI